MARTSKNGIAAAENAADAETDIPLPNEIDGFFRSAWLPSGQHQTFNTREGRQRCGGPRARAPPPVTSDPRLGRLAGPAARRGCRHPLAARRPIGSYGGAVVSTRSGHGARALWATGVSGWRGGPGVRTTDERSLQTGRGAVGAEACGSGHGATMSTPWRGLCVASDRRRKNERKCSRLVAFGLCNADCLSVLQTISCIFVDSGGFRKKIQGAE